MQTEAARWQQGKHTTLSTRHTRAALSILCTTSTYHILDWMNKRTIGHCHSMQHTKAG